MAGVVLGVLEVLRVLGVLLSVDVESMSRTRTRGEVRENCEEASHRVVRYIYNKRALLSTSPPTNRRAGEIESNRRARATTTRRASRGRRRGVGRRGIGALGGLLINALPSMPQIALRVGLRRAAPPPYSISASAPKFPAAQVHTRMDRIPSKHHSGPRASALRQLGSFRLEVQ